jgi:hypothetical protein
MTTNVDDVIVKAALLKVISDFTKAAYNEQRRSTREHLAEGDRKIARSPLDGSKLGAVYVTDPQPECHITDQAALTEWMFEHHPDLTEQGYEIAGSDAEVIDVLFQHAPHLLRPYRRVKSDDMRQLRANAIALGQPIGPASEADIPGIEVHRPEGVVACKPDPSALASVKALWLAGRLELDGTVRAAIEEASDDADA